MIDFLYYEITGRDAMPCVSTVTYSTVTDLARFLG